MPQVSIGLPVYNGEKYLEETIESLLNQTFSDLEIVISDNCSTDHTNEICESYMLKDKRIKYGRLEKNCGAAENYNQTFKRAHGEYFKWAAHDDICGPDYIEKCVQILRENKNICLCYGKTKIMDENGEIIGPYQDDLNLMSLKPDIRLRDFFQIQKVGKECNAVFGVYRSEVLRKTPLIGKYVSSDRVLLGEISLHGKIYEIPEYLFFRRDHSKSSVRANPCIEERANWFDPANKGKVHFVGWRHFIEYGKAITRIQMTYRDKFLCLMILIRWGKKQRDLLTREINNGVRQIIKNLIFRLMEIKKRF